MTPIDPKLIASIASELPQWLGAIEATFLLMRDLNTFGHQIGEAAFNCYNPDPLGQMTFTPHDLGIE